MRTYITISLSKEDLELLGLGDAKESVNLDVEIHEIVEKAITIMVGGKLVQMKITNLPLYREE